MAHQERPGHRRDSADPGVPEGVSWHDLDADAQADLRTLPASLAQRVGDHLAAAGWLIDEDPEAAYAHAKVARRLAQRVALVREAVGLTAYACGRWSEAIAELRAARRLGGSPDHLPLIADAERALGRPQRALELSNDPVAAQLSSPARLELLIVAAGARRDLGQPQAAVRLLDVAALHDNRHLPELARLRYAYADALVDAGDTAGALDWFAKTVELDDDHVTDARERLADLGGEPGSQRVGG